MRPRKITRWDAVIRLLVILAAVLAWYWHQSA
jgi:hypothetical protein